MAPAATRRRASSFEVLHVKNENMGSLQAPPQRIDAMVVGGDVKHFATAVPARGAQAISRK
jgi:hypothetical protein